jgi:hypothetical protein
MAPQTPLALRGKGQSESRELRVSILVLPRNSQPSESSAFYDSWRSRARAALNGTTMQRKNSKKEGSFMAQDLEARFKELEAKVQELYDREAICDLRYRYHEYVNEGKSVMFQISSFPV